MKRFGLLVLLPVVVAMSGCASDLMKPSSGETLVPSDDKATIVFMRTSFVASAIGVEMFEVTNGKLEFIGQLPKGDKLVRRTTPGKKVYMAYGTAADFMIADVRAGKTYYSIVRPNWGTGGFAPTPIRKSGSEFNMKTPEFADWVKNTTPIELKQKEAEEWFAKNKAKYEDIYKDYWNRFERKSPNEKAERTMTPADGV